MAQSARKKGPSVLGCAIMQLLTRHPASGYDLKKRFFASVGRGGWHAYDTQIYRELRRLEAEGYIVGHDAKGRSGPNRRIYRITDQGMETLREWLVSEIDLAKIKDEFSLRVWTADLFPPGEFEAFVRDAQEQWERALEHQQTSLEVLVAEHGDPDTADASIVGRQLALDMSISLTKAKLDWAERTLKLLDTRSLHAEAINGAQD